MDRFELIKNELKKAKSIDPESYFISKGYAVKKEGRHYSVRINDEEVFRTTRLNDGTYVTCDKFSNGIGDNISLVRKIDGCNFNEAISILNKNMNVLSNNINSTKNENLEKTEIKLPRSDNNIVNSGRKYLIERGISLETIIKAEKENFLKYAEGSVFFVGYDEHGKIKNVTKRATNKDDQIQKRDFKGSDKFYPQILKGNEKTVWVVEGGVDALALHDLAKRAGKEPPMVLVTGGANVLSSFKNPIVQEILKNSEKIIISLENEKNQETQEFTNKSHLKQKSLINEVSGKNAEFWKAPNDRGKDLAEYNFKLKQENKVHNNTEQVKYNSLKQKPKLKM